jgi:hypothetical protein
LFYYYSHENPLKPLDASLVGDLLKVIDDHSVLVQGFRMVREFHQLNESIPIQL